METHVLVGIIAIVVYTIISLAIGLGLGYNKTEVSSARGYFLSGGVGPVLLFCTTAATAFSAWIYMGAPGAFFRNGIGFSTAITWQLVGMFLMGTWGPKLWRLAKDNQHITPGEFLQDYYDPKGKSIRLSVALGQLAFCIPTMMAQVAGVGLAVDTLTGGLIPFWAGCLYAAGVVAIYVYFGGLKSMAWVDAFQGVLFMSILWGSVLIMMFRPELGGLGGLFDRIREIGDNYLLYQPFTGNWNIRNYIGFFIVQSIGITLAPYVLQKTFAAKSGATIKKTAASLSFFYIFVIMLPVMLIGFGGLALGVAVENADSILVVTLTEFAPMFGVVAVIGIVAAGMSTFSSIAISVSSLITMDLVRILKPNLEDQKLRTIARIVVLCLVVVSVTAAIVGTDGIVVLINTAMAGFAQAFWPIFGVLVWRRATKQGALAAWLVGITTAVVLTWIGNHTGNHMFGFIPGFWGLLFSGIALFAVSLMTKPMDKSHQEEFLKPITEATH